LRNLRLGRPTTRHEDTADLREPDALATDQKSKGLGRVQQQGQLLSGWKVQPLGYQSWDSGRIPLQEIDCPAMFQDSELHIHDDISVRREMKGCMLFPLKKHTRAQILFSCDLSLARAHFKTLRKVIMKQAI
jgi:hypothetical protein